MTQNQISFYKAREDQRHNKEQEKLSRQSNRITSKHYKNQDQYTSEHYQRSDTAGLISANASAMNAQAAATNAATNRKNYEMNYDIEYGWTNVPLTVTEAPDYTNPDATRLYYNYPAGMPLSAQKKDAEAMTALTEALYSQRQSEAGLAEKVSNVLNRGSGAFSNVFNALYGKRGLLGALESVVVDE